MTTPPRARVRDLVVRLVGCVHLVAFLSLWLQLDVLMGSRGLLPAREWLQATRFAATPSVFHAVSSDPALHAGAALGVLASVGVLLGFAPRLLLPVLWGLYLSFAHAGSTFFEFQWDTLLLESTFVLWFASPWGWRPRRAPGPGTWSSLLVLGLVVKLHVESGLAKLVTGDETWRDFTAMASYYETVPLPTPLSWWAHQLPLSVHRATSLGVLVVEIVLPILALGPHRVRGALCAVLVALQAGTQLTGNFGFFNVLTAVLCLFLLDDEHLAWLYRRRWPERPRRADGWPEKVVFGAWAFLSVFPFARFCGVEPPLLPLYRPLRTINAYHLFARMTLVRCEVVIEGSQDGERWEPYELRYKPGDPTRAPRFIAPHQPRVDFKLWFARLGDRDLAYLEALVKRLLERPEVVSELFEKMPFDGMPPRYVRIVTYQYTFTDRATRAETGAYWDRMLLPRETTDVFHLR